MNENRLGTAFNWAELCCTSAQALREKGVEGALWEVVAPIAGPDGAQMPPERMLSVFIFAFWQIYHIQGEKLEKEDELLRQEARASEAVRIFSENPPDSFDVVLMDIMMPMMNGYEATHAIRTMQNRPDACAIPIIAMTANAFAEDIQQSMKAGMNAHIAKPISVDEVVKIIARNLN